MKINSQHVKKTAQETDQIRNTSEAKKQNWKDAPVTAGCLRLNETK